VRDLARQAALSQATIRGLEHGNDEPTQQAKDRVAQALGWTPDIIATILQGGSPAIDTTEDRRGVDDTTDGGPKAHER